VFAWGCNPCLSEVGGHVLSLVEALDEAHGHARTHWFARAVYYDG
jgi:hypothetical protein